MDFNKLVARAKAILIQPKSEWPVIAEEPATVADLFKGYILWLAAASVLASFIKTAVIGHMIPFVGMVRTPIGPALISAIISLALTLASVYVMAIIVEALAPTFGGQKDRTQALKAVAYASTAAWLASIAVIVPALGWLIAIAGAVYSIYLLYLGLPHTMKSPPDKAVGYTAVSIIIAIVVWFVVGAIVGSITAIGLGVTGASSYIGRSVTVDKDSPLDKLEEWGKSVEEATKKLEAAQASGDQAAQQEAFAQMMGAALGGGAAVTALRTDQLKPFLPDSLLGYARSRSSVERNSAMGLEITTATATYTDEDTGRSLDLEIVDTASAKGLLALAGFAGMMGERETDGTVEKIFRDGDRQVREYWDRNSSSGEYSVIVGERFVVKVSGEADSVQALKAALKDVDLRKLEKLKNEGA